MMWIRSWQLAIYGGPNTLIFESYSRFSRASNRPCRTGPGSRT